MQRIRKVLIQIGTFPFQVNKKKKVGMEYMQVNQKTFSKSQNKDNATGWYFFPHLQKEK
jgi:hypothetical protein